MRLFKQLALLTTVLLVGLLAPALLTAQAEGEIGLPIEFSGTVQSVNGAILVVNNQTIDTGMVTLTTPPQVGDLVGVRGQLLQDGRIIASSVVILTAQVTPMPTTIPLPTPQPGSQGICPRPTDYWAQPDTEWAASTLMLGAQSYNEAELRALLANTTASGDVSVRLAQQLIVAKLNIAEGASTEPIGATIVQADTLLSQLPGRVPYGLLPTAVNGAAMLTSAGLLDSYNRGLTTPYCRPAEPVSDDDDEPPAPQTIIIEGPVTSINGNLIRIYSFDVLVQPDNPLLRRVRVGDVIRVDGTLEMRADVVILVATTVQIVNPPPPPPPPRGDDGSARPGDDASRRCQNPPPEHAPAHGWRAQCEDGPHPGRGNGRGNGRGDDGSGSRSG